MITLGYDSPSDDEPAAKERPSDFNWFRLAVVLGPLIAWVVVRNRPPWGDEEHFLHTVRIFGQGLSWDLLRSYPEMSAPLTYVLYAAWGSLAGFDTPTLRLLSPLIAAATVLVWYAFLGDVNPSKALALLALFTIVLNPYFAGLSVFVFTDMLSLLGLAVTAIGVSRRKAWLAACGLALATCSRQYLAFLAPAVIGGPLIGSRGVGSGKWILASVAGMMPLGALVVLWGGHLAPSNAIREVYTADGLRFDPHALSLYISAPAAYLLPLTLIALPQLRRSWSPALLIAAVLAALFVVLVPVAPSLAQTREGSFTVGFLHRAVELMLGNTGSRVVFPVLAFVNIWTMGVALESGVRSLGSARRPDAEIFVWLAIAAFLAVMPFSYMPWEKYALPLLMLQSVTLAQLIGRRRSHRPAPPPRR